ncbi:hypothetical protein MUP59_10255 [Candidatus Bathyarchaeota archaeon]|jgi:hypothetical protein|nr:hypothetical protein [Candidatus Bathyarchaeota archaeon]
MTFAIQPYVKAEIQDIDRARSEESFVIAKAFERSLEHFLKPFSRQWSDPLVRFYTLKTEWEADTAHLSSITEIVIHPAYQQIIGLGPVAIPLILSEMKKKSGQWFWALKSITGEDPVSPEKRGRIRDMTQAWLRWGQEQGYLV